MVLTPVFLQLAMPTPLMPSPTQHQTTQALSSWPSTYGKELHMGGFKKLWRTASWTRP